MEQIIIPLDRNVKNKKIKCANVFNGSYTMTYEMRLWRLY